MSNAKNIKAIIFDCDGTLVASEEAHLMAWKRVADDWKVTLSHEDYISYVGKPDLLIAERIKPEATLELLRQKINYYGEYIAKGLPPITGTVDFVKRLIEEKNQHPLKLGVASAATKREIMINLKSLEIDHFFDVILSGQDDLNHIDDPTGVNKPKPYIYLHAAKLLGVSPLECIVIEDSHTGVSAGVDAGCITVAIPNCHSKHQDFSKAHFIFESLSGFSVKEFLEKIKVLA